MGGLVGVYNVSLHSLSGTKLGKERLRRYCGLVDADLAYTVGLGFATVGMHPVF